MLRSPGARVRHRQGDARRRRASRLTAHGTLYKALGRLADAGLLEHRWEDADAALTEGRPRRRLYRISAVGQRALADTRATSTAARPAPRIAPT